MPEGPEVKIMANGLNSVLAGKVIKSFEIVSGPYADHQSPVFAKTRHLINKLQITMNAPNKAIIVRSVNTHGKFIYMMCEQLERVRTETGYQTLVKSRFYIGSSLGLKGEWVSIPQGPLNAENAVRFRIRWSDTPKGTPRADQVVLYTDTMKQGKLNILTQDELDKKLSTLGPDPWSGSFEQFKAKMATKKAQKMQVFEMLMEQNLVAGVGNYLRAEILYNVKQDVDAFALVSTLKESQLKTLWLQIVSLSKHVVKVGSARYGARGYVPRIYKNTIAPDGSPIKTIVGKNKRIFYYT